LNHPTVSVILPVYNGEQYLRLAIDSVLNQTFRDFELIVIDDGSVDSTPSIVREYGEQLKYVRQDNTGVAGAFNHGLRLATGRYISWLSHDDVFLPAKLERQVEALSQTTVPSVCYTDVQMIDSQGRIVGERNLPQHSREDALRHVLTAGPICSASYSILYDRRCLDEIGVYSTELRQAQDVDMLARFASHFPMIRVPGCLMQIREHGARGIRSKKWEREIYQYFSDRLNTVPLEELFPDAKPVTRPERARAFLWLADRLASVPIPVYQKIARAQYRRALSEHPAIGPTLAVHYVFRLAAAFRLGIAALAANPEMLTSLLKKPD